MIKACWKRWRWPGMMLLSISLSTPWRWYWNEFKTKRMIYDGLEKYYGQDTHIWWYIYDMRQCVIAMVTSSEWCLKSASILVIWLQPLDPCLWWSWSTLIFLLFWLLILGIGYWRHFEKTKKIIKNLVEGDEQLWGSSAGRRWERVAGVGCRGRLLGWRTLWGWWSWWWWWQRW